VHAGPRVSLLLPNRNNAPVLNLVLGRLAETATYSDVEVVVVDRGSRDASRDILRRRRGAGCSRRFRLVEKACVQLGADASVETAGWVERTVRLLLIDRRVGAVTAKGTRPAVLRGRRSSRPTPASAGA
jgi:GT2 family glycosyltransferase